MASERIEEDELLHATPVIFEPSPSSIHAAGKKYLVPNVKTDMKAVVVYVSGLKTDTVQHMALVVVPGWICMCNEEGLREYIAMDEVVRVREVEMPYSRPTRDPEGNIVHVNVRKARGVIVEVERGNGAFMDELRLAALHPREAADLQRGISQAIGRYHA